MPPLVETTATPAEAVKHEPAEGAQPPIEQATQVAIKDEPTREEKARALLQGEPPKDLPPDPNDEQAMLDAQFDPETGELLEEEPAESGDRRPPFRHAQGPELAEGETGEEEAPAETGERRPESGEEDEEADGGDRKARRIRVKRDALSDRDFAILTLAKDKRITFAEAEQQLFGKAAPKEEPAQPQRTAEELPNARQMADRMESLRMARDKARGQLDDAGADRINDQMIELRDQLKQIERLDATRAQAARQTAAQKYATDETAAITRVTELYPEANTAGSKLNDAMQARAAEYREQDPAFFHNPKWPMHLAAETATELGIAAKTPGQAGKPAPAAAPLAPPKKTTRPAPTPAPGTATGAKTNTEAALRERLNAAKANRDVEGIKAVMRELSASA